jgi:hypothetical protein
MPLRVVWLAIAFCLFDAWNAYALIQGGEGNKPVSDPGWPAGAAAVFNTKHRIAWWEGPPFGGGQWHAECQGNTDAFNETLQDFQKLDVPTKRLIVRNGSGSSFWLDPNRQSAGASAIELDWTFMVWQKDRWDFQQQLPPGISATRHSAKDPGPTTPPATSDARTIGPVPELCVYAGGAIRWEQVRVPEGIEVVDERLEAHGFSLQDERVLEGTIWDSGSSMPLAATIRLEKIIPKQEGGYDHELMVSVTADSQGHWVIKNVPSEWCQVVAIHDGYCPRVIHHIRYLKQPGWEQVNSRLGRLAAITGRFLDENDAPLAGVKVSVVQTSLDGLPYGLTQELETMSGVDGTFSVNSLAGGTASLRAFREGYVLPGLRPTCVAPSQIELKLYKSGSLVVRVEFTNKPAGDYLIHMQAKEGEKKGSWGGSGNIDPNHEIRFDHVPPGEYVLYGMPNPGSETQRTDQVAIRIVGGEEKLVEISAK